MGEVADLVLEGVLCQKCGVAIIDKQGNVMAMGFPQDCEDCMKESYEDELL